MTQIQLTGHPFIDIGLATLTAMAGKTQLADINEGDLRACGEQMTVWYARTTVVRNYISIVFLNSHFAQMKMSEVQREDYAARILFAFLKDRPSHLSDTPCAFFPSLAAVETAYRQHIPLLTAEAIRNFTPMGSDGVPVSGLALLAVHALPMGCLKCGGRLLGFHQHSTNPAALDTAPMLFAMARRNYHRNRTAIAQAGTSGRFPDFGGRPRPRYVTEIINTVRQEGMATNASLDYITGYSFTNYGAGPEIRLVRLDHTVLRFLHRTLEDVGDAWDQAVELNWQPSTNSEMEAEEDSRIAHGRYNPLYELLFELPGQALAFLSALRRASRWDLIERFLEEILLMDQERIDTYKRLGDRLAEYARLFEKQPQTFYHNFSRATSYTALRRLIRVAAERMYKAGTPNPLFSYDDFITAFEHPSDRYRNWLLARDLLAIRMLERLQDAHVDLSHLPDETSDFEALDQEEKA